MHTKATIDGSVAIDLVHVRIIRGRKDVSEDVAHVSKENQDKVGNVGGNERKERGLFHFRRLVR
jgi:hypothetical protein